MSAPLPRKQIFTITGEGQKNDNGTDRQRVMRDCQAGDLVILERQPKNSSDSNAIFVRLTESGEGIGYVAREENRQLAAALDAGADAKARLHKLVGGLDAYPSFGCHICVVPADKAFRVAVPLRSEQRLYTHAPDGRKRDATRRTKSTGRNLRLVTKILKSLFK